MTAAAPIRRAEGQGGFTLIELLVVLATIAVILALVPVYWPSGSRAGVEARTVARQVADDVRLVRDAAILGDGETSITLDLEGAAYVANPGNRSRGLPTGMALGFRGSPDQLDGDVAEIRFFPDGTSTGGEILLSRGHDQHRVTVHWLTGGVALDE